MATRRRRGIGYRPQDDRVAVVTFLGIGGATICSCLVILALLGIGRGLDAPAPGIAGGWPIGHGIVVLGILLVGWSIIARAMLRPPRRTAARA